MQIRQLFYLFASIQLVVTQYASAREWQDATGGYKVEAYCVAVESDSIRLKRADGNSVVVPLAKLSAADQAYAKELETFDRAILCVRKSQPAKAYEILRESKHPLCRSLCGFLLGQNLKVEGFLLHDPQEANRIIAEQLEWLEKNRDDPRSEEMLGTLSMYGVGMPQDLKKAADYLSNASNHDRASAKGRLAILYLLGKGIERSDARAVELLESAAKDGDVMSQFNLGVLYLHGAKIEKSSSKGISWLSKASTNGNPRAMAAWAEELLSQWKAIDVPKLQPDRRDLKAQRDYRMLVEKRNKLLAQATELATKSHELGCGEGTYALASVTLQQSTDGEDKAKKTIRLWEEAANRNSVKGILSVAHLTRSDDGRKLLADNDLNWRDLLDQARAIDVLGQYSAAIEEYAEQWRNEDSKRAEESADYERRAKKAQLILIDWNWRSTASDTFVEASGQVKNVSPENLRNVTAVVTYFTDEGKFITSDEALISFNPLLPGQTSTFRVIGQCNPAMKRASIEFKSLLGGTIPWVQERKGE